MLRGPAKADISRNVYSDEITASVRNNEENSNFAILESQS